MQLLANGLIAGSLAALIASGLALVYGTLGVFNLALGQTVLFGGYAAWWLHQEIGLHLLPSILGGLGAGALLSWLTFEVFVEPFFRRHRFLPLVTTIALSMMLDGAILLLFEERPVRILTGLREPIEIFGARTNAEQLTLIAVTLCILALTAYVLHATPLGRRIRAVVLHPEAAMSLGIPANFLNRITFVGSGILAAAGGIFIGIDQNLSPTLAFPITIKAYAAIIAGGKGNLWGAILCAYAIAFLEQFAVGVPWLGGSYLPAGYQNAVALFVIIVFLLLKPMGLFSTRTRHA